MSDNDEVIDEGLQELRNELERWIAWCILNRANLPKSKLVHVKRRAQQLREELVYLSTLTGGKRGV